MEVRLLKNLAGLAMLHAAVRKEVPLSGSREAPLLDASFPVRESALQRAPLSAPPAQYAREADRELVTLREYARDGSYFKLRIRFLRIENFFPKDLREAISVKLASDSTMKPVLEDLVARGAGGTLRRFVRLGVDPYLDENGRSSLLTIAAHHHSLGTARSLVAALLRGKSESREIKAEDADLSRLMASTVRTLNRAQFEEFRTICRKSSGALVPQSYLLSMAHARGRFEARRAPLAEALPQFLNAFAPHDLSELVTQIGKAKAQVREEVLPELLAFLKHPHASKGESELTTLALNAISPKETPYVSHSLFSSYQKIGVLCHSFQKWRFEAMRTLARAGGGASSLLEAFGFTPIPARTTDETRGEVKGFGPGFLLRPKMKSSSDSYRGGSSRDITATIEFRRAYLMAHEEYYGTLIIRNSSPHFGRDTLRYPAYWAPPGRLMNAQAALMLTREEIEKNFIPLPLTKNIELWEGEQSISHLVKQIELVSDRFSAWKCDTSADTAWNRGKGAKVLKGGFYSEGFIHLLEVLKTLIKKNEELGTGVVPELAFVHRRSTPWAPYLYKSADGATLSRLSIDERKLSILERLATRKFVAEEEINDSGIRAFFQEAGFNMQGELVLLAPSR